MTTDTTPTGNGDLIKRLDKTIEHMGDNMFRQLFTESRAALKEADRWRDQAWDSHAKYLETLAALEMAKQYAAHLEERLAQQGNRHGYRGE